MQCNIDERGRPVRMVWGVGMLIVAALLAGATWWGWVGAGWGIGLSVGAAALGVLGVYEARKRWCVVRAMGFRTPV